MTTTAALAALSALPLSFSTSSDGELLSLAEQAATMQRLVNTHAAAIAGELAARPDLARRLGHRTPEELLRATSGSTASEASQAVRVGGILQSTDPWLQPIAAGLREGSLSPSAADSIRTGLGEPTSDIPSTLLVDAAAALVDEASAIDATRLIRRARERRDELDEAGIANREAARHAARSLRVSKLSDGMTLLSWRLDPESAAVVTDLYDRSTSPRRGGPRFDDDVARSIADDTRSTEQLASDVFLTLLQHGAAADSSHLLGDGPAVVRVVSMQQSAHVFIEGQHDPISHESVERLACSGAVQRVTLDAQGQPLDVGRERRLFTARQRVALAIRDGGCRWPGCDRPPSWTEAHHVRHWLRDRGSTDVANGLLLCRHHHLLLHNERWHIERDGADFWLTPPAHVDALQRRRLMPSKSRVARELAG